MRWRETWLVMGMTALALGAWPIQAHVPHDRITGLQVVESDEGVEAVVRARGRLYRSLNGVTFERRHTGIACDQYISAVAVAPGGHMVAVCKSRLYVSDDGGQSFVGRARTGVYARDVRLSRAFGDDRSMILSGPGPRFGLSRDGGASVQLLKVDGGASAVSWSGPRPLVGTRRGALVAINARDEVVPIAMLPGRQQIRSVAEHSVDAVAFVGTEGGDVFRVDLKTGYAGKLHTFPGPVVSLAFALTSRGPRLAAVTDEAGVFVSSDGGHSFVHHARGIGRAAQSTAYQQRMFYDVALTERGGVWVGTFTGLYRAELSDLEGPLAKASERRFAIQPLSWGHVVGLGVASLDGGGVVANLSLYGGGLHRVTIRDGRELEIIVGHPDVTMTRLGTSAALGSVVLASHYGHVTLSTDGGERWRQTRLTPAPQSVHALKRRVLRGAAKKMPALQRRGLSRVLIDSEEGPLDGTPLSAAISPTVDVDQTLFVGVAPNGLMRSEDLGASFTMVWGAEGESPRSIAPSPTYQDDGVVWIATATDVFRSDARGRRPARCGIGGEPFRPQLAFVDDGASGLVFLGARQGLFVSPDACGEWRSVDIGAGDAPIIALEASPAFVRDRTFFAQAAGHHLQRCTLPPEGQAACVDLGRSFLMTPVASRDGNDLLAVSPTFEDDGVLVAVDDATVYVSRDRGASFDRIELLRRYEVGMGGASWLYLPARPDKGWSVEGRRKSSANRPLVAERAGASLSVDIVGTQVRLVGDRGPAGGRFRVWMDGEVLDTADSFAATEQQRVVIWSHRFQEVGRHRLRIEALGESERRALGTRVTLHAIDVVR